MLFFQNTIEQPNKWIFIEKEIGLWKEDAKENDEDGKVKFETGSDWNGPWNCL